MKRDVSKHILIITGEPSGDLHGANLIREIKRLRPDIGIHAIGGDRIRAQGVEVLKSCDNMAVVGFWEIFKSIKEVYDAYRKAIDFIKERRPELIILIDYPGFNLRIAKIAKRYGIKVLYYILPQMWAWREGRIRKVKRWVDKAAVILPFEEEFYKGKGIDVEYVGHPIMDNIYEDDEIDAIIEREDAYPIIGIVPGSREDEIKRHLKPMLLALEGLKGVYPRIMGLVSVVPDVDYELIEEGTKSIDVPLKLSKMPLLSLLKICDFAFVSSGTATLEAAISDTPFVLVYKISPLTYLMAKLAVRISNIGLVNLISGRRIVPELIQHEFTPSNLIYWTQRILEDTKMRNDIIRGLRMVKSHLGKKGASFRTANIAINLLEG